MIGQRIKQLRNHLNLTQQVFADRLGLKQNTIATYEIGRLTPSDRTIADICREFGASETWLRTGDGEMLLPSDPDTEIDTILGEIAGSDDKLIKKIIKAYWRLDDHEKEVIQKFIDSLQ